MGEGGMSPAARAGLTQALLSGDMHKAAHIHEEAHHEEEAEEEEVIKSDTDTEEELSESDTDSDDPEESEHASHVGTDVASELNAPGAPSTQNVSGMPSMTHTSTGQLAGRQSMAGASG